MQDVLALTVAELDAALAATCPGTPRLQEYLAGPVVGVTLPDPNNFVELDRSKGGFFGPGA